MTIVTLGVLADHLGVSERQVQALARRGTLPKVAVGQYDLREACRAYCAGLREQAAGRLGRDGSLDPVHENAALKRSMRELNEIKKAELEGRLVPVDEIEPAWARIMTAIRAQVLGVPGRLRFRLPHLTAHDGQVAEEVCRDALEAAADEAEPWKST